MPDFRFFPKHVKIKNDRRDDFSGIKREIKMSSVSISGKDIWTGYQAEDFRKMVLDFVGTNFDKDKIHFKPISVEVANDLIRNNIGYLALFLESRKDQTMKIAQMDLAGFEGITGMDKIFNKKNNIATKMFSPRNLFFVLIIALIFFKDKQ